MLKSNLLALAVLAISTVCLAGPPTVTGTTATPRTVEPARVLRAAVAETPGLANALRTAGLSESLAPRVAAAGVTWDVNTVRTIERMPEAQKSIFEAALPNALATIEAARTAGVLSQKGAEIVAAAYKAVEIAPTTSSSKFTKVAEALKVETNNAASLTNDALAMTIISNIEAALGASLTALLDCTPTSAPL